MKFPTLALALTTWPALAGAADRIAPVQLLCSTQTSVCTSFVLRPDDRFDPFVQQLLVQDQLRAQPKDWRVIYFYAPDIDEQVLEEMQIRFLNELIEKGKSAESSD